MSSKTRQSKLKKTILKIPILRDVALISWNVMVLPNRQQETLKEINSLRAEVTDSLNANNTLVKNMESRVSDMHSVISGQDKFNSNFSNQLADIKHQLLLFSSSQFAGASTSTSKNQKTSELLVDDHGLDKYYIDFENKFRGPEEEIEERLKFYVPMFKKFKTDYSKFPVLDIGCGRGEMLKVLKEHGIEGLGIDLNESMVKRANENGFKAVQAEALEFLMNQKAASFSVITGFHIVEHIPFNTLIRLFEECHRVLKPGGFIIFETPNPESIHVGSFAFYYDPSHLHPIPPEVLAFTIENRGFRKAEIVRLHPRNDEYNKTNESQDPLVQEIVERFHGPQDYAVIGYK